MTHLHLIKMVLSILLQLRKNTIHFFKISSIPVIGKKPYCLLSSLCDKKLMRPILIRCEWVIKHYKTSSQDPKTTPELIQTSYNNFKTILFSTKKSKFWTFFESTPVPLIISKYPPKWVKYHMLQVSAQR